jgi:hypothetical protein
MEVIVTAISSLVGEHGLRYALGWQEGLLSFTRKSNHTSFIEISKQAIFFLTKT